MGNHNKPKIKIVNTIGPSITQKIWDHQILKNNPAMTATAKKMCEELIASGSNVARFNFSHGSEEEQLVRIELLREASKKLNIPYSFLLDTKGPEIRVCKFPDEGIAYEKGQTIKIYTLKKDLATKDSFCVYDSSGKYNMAKDCKVGNKILVEDGKLILIIKKVNIASGIVEVETCNTHTVKTNKRINLPGASYSMPFLSEKDKNDLVFACKQKLDYVAPSFVSNVQNVKQIHDVLNKNGGKDIKIISKIENCDGIKNLDAIIAASDGIMVARGDLGSEIPYAEVPYWEKQMICKCRAQNKPIIVATQMLDSMEKNLLATRAEVMDVYIAGQFGTDAVMTSGETAQGQFPINVVNTMRTINEQSEDLFHYSKAAEHAKLIKGLSPKNKKIASDIAKLTCPKNEGTLKNVFPYEFVVIFENDLKTIEAISGYRPGANIIAVIDKPDLYTKFGITYGITTYLVDDLNKAKKDYKKIAKNAVDHYSTGSKKYAIYLNGKVAPK